MGLPLVRSSPYFRWVGGGHSHSGEPFGHRCVAELATGREAEGGRHHQPGPQLLTSVAGCLLDLGVVVLRDALLGVDQRRPVDLLEVAVGEGVTALGVLGRVGV